MKQSEHPREARDQALSPAGHIAGAWIGATNVRTERASQSVLVIVKRETVLCDVLGIDAADLPRAGHQRASRHVPSDHRLGQPYCRSAAARLRGHELPEAAHVLA